MVAFVWQSCFVTGEAVVDEQHQALVALINNFSDVLMLGGPVEDRVVVTALDALSDYALLHFREEEALMKRERVDLRTRRTHRACHLAFEQALVSMRVGADVNRARALSNFLVNWLAQHILEVDQSLARELRAIRAGVSPARAHTAERRLQRTSTDPLVLALQSLFQLVSERNAELDEANRELERRVAERTAQLELANVQLQALALTDPLTSLGNRRSAMSCLDPLWADGQALSVLLVDVDGLKGINDTLGHDAGDALIVNLARSLAGAVRTDDIVCRVGGDEFMILCPRADTAGAVTVAENVRRVVDEQTTTIAGRPAHVTVSVGVATRRPDLPNPTTLIQRADLALYEAKRAGRNCVVVSEPSTTSDLE